MTIPSVIDLIEKNRAVQVTEQAAETAAENVRRQEMAARSGKLKRVIVVGPNDTPIPSYYDEAERAFYPVFEE